MDIKMKNKIIALMLISVFFISFASAGGDIFTQSGNCFIELVVGDKVSMRTADIGGSGTANLYSANLNLVRIGNI